MYGSEKSLLCSAFLCIKVSCLLRLYQEGNARE